MIEIDKFTELYSVSRYRLADCWEYPRNQGESDKSYLKRKDECLRRRANSGWLIMYEGGKITMRSNTRGTGDTYGAGDLDKFVKVI